MVIGVNFNISITKQNFRLLRLKIYLTNQTLCLVIKVNKVFGYPSVRLSKWAICHFDNWTFGYREVLLYWLFCRGPFMNKAPRAVFTKLGQHFFHDALLIILSRSNTENKNSSFTVNFMFSKITLLFDILRISMSDNCVINVSHIQ